MVYDSANVNSAFFHLWLEVAHTAGLKLREFVLRLKSWQLARRVQTENIQPMLPS